LRGYAVKIELVTASGDHIRYIAGPMAKAMVASGAATIHNSNGRVKSIKLAQPAASFARRIGEASPPSISSPRFVRRVRSDDHALWWYEHHPRCTYE